MFDVIVACLLFPLCRGARFKLLDHTKNHSNNVIKYRSFKEIGCIVRTFHMDQFEETLRSGQLVGKPVTPIYKSALEGGRMCGSGQSAPPLTPAITTGLAT